MKREEILQKAQKKVLVGEMEKINTNKGNWIALIVAGVVAVAFMIVEGVMRHFSAIFALGAVCYAWASAMYICQFVLAKRPWPVLIGAVLHGIAFVIMIVVYILSIIQAW